MKEQDELSLEKAYTILNLVQVMMTIQLRKNIEISKRKSS